MTKSTTTTFLGFDSIDFDLVIIMLCYYHQNQKLFSKGKAASSFYVCGGWVYMVGTLVTKDSIYNLTL